MGTEDVILITQTCTPRAEEVCSTETWATEEIEYEKVCKEIVDTLCDAAAPVAYAGYHKREAEAEAEADADAHYGLAAPLAVGHHAGYAAAPVAVAHHAAPVAVAHHAAPVAVAHHVAPAPVAHAVAHSVTATVKHACREVTSTPVENKLPMTTCEAVVTTATQHATVPVAAPVAPVAHAVGYGHGVVAHAGY